MLDIHRYKSTKLSGNVIRDHNRIDFLDAGTGLTDVKSDRFLR
jgi:hypothetical protein